MSMICAAMVALATGCASIQCTSPGLLEGVKVKGADGAPSQLVFIESAGFYMFWSVPLASGDVRWNEEKKNIEGGFSLFKNHITMDNMQTAITKYAESRDCDLVDILYNVSGSSFASASQAGLIGSLFGSAQMSVSGVLVPRSGNRQGK